MPIFLDLYNSIYAVKRSPQTYVDTVRGLERRIREWREQWPADLIRQSASENELGHSHAQYLEIFILHMRLLLRHPSLSLTSNVEFNRENLTVCLDVSGKMLHHVKQLQKFRSLDGTWQTAALYVLAISTTLFAHWERRDQITVSALAALKDEMNAWLSIIGEMGHYMGGSGGLFSCNEEADTSTGSGRKLQDTVRVTIERTLNLLSQHLTTKYAQSPPITSKAPVPGSIIPTAQRSAQIVHNQAAAYASYESSNNNLTSCAQQHSNGQVTTLMQSPSVTTHTTSVTYHTPPQFPYQPQYTRTPTTFEQQPFAQTDTLPATAAAANAYMSNYQQPQEAPTAYPPNSGFAAATTYHSPGSPSSWRQFAGDITSNIDPGTEYMSSASALMQLGRNEGPPQQQMQMGIDAQQRSNMNGGPQQSWPFILFDNGPGAG